MITPENAANHFKITTETLNEILFRVSEVFYHLIEYPTTNEQLVEIKQAFMDQSDGFPNVIGIIGTEKIIGNGFTLLQGIVDHQLKFTDVNVCPPRADKTIPTIIEVFNSKDNYFFQNIKNDMENFILGNPPFPCSTFLLTPISVKKTAGQGEYNRRHKILMKNVKNAFNLLTRRFRQLNYLTLDSSELISKFLMSCCAIHNRATENDTILDDELSDEEDQQQNLMSKENHEEQGIIIKEKLAKCFNKKN